MKSDSKPNWSRGRSKSRVGALVGMVITTSHVKEKGVEHFFDKMWHIKRYSEVEIGSKLLFVTINDSSFLDR